MNRAGAVSCRAPYSAISFEKGGKGLSKLDPSFSIVNPLSWTHCDDVARAGCTGPPPLDAVCVIFLQG